MTKILDFWNSQAREYGASDKASNPDSHYREIEIRRVVEWLRGTRILDVGCGNGYSTMRYRQAHPASYVGMDFSNEMLNYAREHSSDIEWWHGDILSDLPPITFDTIVSCRCLINLGSWEQQQKALLNMKSRLKPGGQIILVENFLDGLHCLNDARATFGLHPIEVRWHNRYMLLEEFDEFAARHFAVVEEENIGNLYYLVSRVLAAKIAQLAGREPDYDNELNRLAVDLPHVDGIYSPNYLMILEAQP